MSRALGPSAGELQDGATLGEFVLGAELGRGKFGIVFAATREVDGKRFAVKVLKDASSAESEEYLRFFKEVQAMGRVKHPNIVEVYTIGNDNGTVYYPMEYLAGETLAARVKRGPVMALREVADMALPVAMALQNIHKAGFVHRDLKPANLFLSQGPDGRWVPKVLDFGIVKDLDPERNLHETRKGLLLGTPVYMSPEQWEDSAGVTAQSDQFSFGAILYECFTGQRLFKGSTVEVIALQIAKGEIPPLQQVAPAVPEVIGAAVRRMLERAPEKRFKSMRDVAAVFMPFASPALQREFASDFEETVPMAFMERSVHPSAFERAMYAPGERLPALAPLREVLTEWEAASREVPSLPPRRGEESRGEERALRLLWGVTLVALAVGAVALGRGASRRTHAASAAVTGERVAPGSRVDVADVSSVPRPENLDASLRVVVAGPDVSSEVEAEPDVQRDVTPDRALDDGASADVAASLDASVNRDPPPGAARADGATRPQHVRRPLPRLMPSPYEGY